MTSSGYALQPGITHSRRRAERHHRPRRRRQRAASPASPRRRRSGTLQLTDFVNPAGLQPRGENLLVETAASGPAQTGTPGLNGLGTLQQGSLEASNVNVVEELVNMIETQRAYEMNSKAISTTDQMLAVREQPVCEHAETTHDARPCRCSRWRCCVSGCAMLPADERPRIRRHLAGRSGRCRRPRRWRHLPGRARRGAVRERRRRAASATRSPSAWRRTPARRRAPAPPPTRPAKSTLPGPTVVRPPVTINGTPILEGSMDNESSFDGKGDSKQSNALDGQITVTVAQAPRQRQSAGARPEVDRRSTRAANSCASRASCGPSTSIRTTPFVSSKVADAYDLLWRPGRAGGRQHAGPAVALLQLAAGMPF